jgi:hypothetical protein
MHYTSKFLKLLLIKCTLDTMCSLTSLKREWDTLIIHYDLKLKITGCYKSISHTTGLS